MNEYRAGQSVEHRKGKQLLDELTLNVHEPLVRSKTRWIFEHPADSNFLIKVHIPRLSLSNEQSFRALAEQKKDRFLYLSGMLRDFRQYIDSQYGDVGMIRDRITPIHGVVKTDLGLGLIVSAIRAADGQLAPTLKRLFEQKALSESRIKDLKVLLNAIVDSRLTFADLNLDNIVLQGADSEQEQFVVIDGLGDRTWIPVQQWFGWLRKHKKKQFQAKVIRFLRESGYE